MKRRLWKIAFVIVASGLPVVSALAAKSEKELTREADQFIASKPEALKPFFHSLYMEGEWNSVLNFDLLALAAIEVNRPDIAERALDEASSRIMRIYADDANATKAKSLWSAESVKDFKGEPYERAMTFFYRGMLYLRVNDYQNARAAFLQADIQDAMGQTERFDRSFTLPVYLAAWASACDGDAVRAEELLGRTKNGAVDPFYRSSENSLPRQITLMERGIGPEKVTLGEAKSILGFLPHADVRGSFTPRYLQAVAPQAAGTVASVDWLALTRGGRPIQGILNGKVEFKETTGNVANVSGAIAQAAFYSSLASLGSDRNAVARNMGMLGAGAALVGSFAFVLSQSTRTEADTRYWGSLPKYFSIQTFAEPANGVDHFDSSYSGTPRPVLLKSETNDRCSFYYGREFSALDAVQGGVGNPSPWPAEPVEDNRVQSNAQFRNMLRSTF